MKNWLITIPARLHSTRLPEKPLQLLGGKPLITRVYENLLPLEKEGNTIIVATDDEKVLKVCQEHNTPAMMTSIEHQCGTDRCQEVADSHNHPYILNVQGDEPFVKIEDLKNLMSAFQTSKSHIGTLAFESNSEDDWKNPNVVKAVITNKGKALYFSRSPIPARSHNKQEQPFSFLHHMGIYAYKKEALKLFCSLEPGTLEKLESLEQLRALENNLDIMVIKASAHSPGIDTPEDLESAHALL